MQESKTQSYLLPESWVLRYGLIGVTLGATAPAAFLFLEKTLFHPQLSLRDFLVFSVLSSPRDLLTHGFLFGAVFVLGIAGAIMGSFQKRDARRRVELEERNMELSALNAISEIIARSRDLDGLLHGVLRETLELSFLSIEKKGVVFIADPNGETCRMAASYNLSPGLAALEERIAIGHCLCGKVAQTGKLIISDDCFDDERHQTRYQGMERHGHIVIPINGKDRVLGVMCFYLSPGTAPARTEVKVLESVASQLSVAIENVRLLEEVMQANERARKKNLENEMNMEVLSSLVEVDRLIMSAGERDEMLCNVSRQVRQSMRADVGVIALRDPDSGSFACVTAWGVEIRKGDLVMGPEDCGGAEWQALVRKPDGRGGCPPIEKIMAENGVKRSVAVPILRQDKVEGALVLGSFSRTGLNRKDAGTAMSFASRMGMALEHVRLICSLRDLSVDVIHTLASAIDAKSPWTKGHSERVAEYAVAIGDRMGLSARQQERLRLAGLLHDIGKIGTYDTLLDKEGRLTSEERELIKLHPERGCEILGPIKDLSDILPAVRHHHERWDGKGYPDGLKGEEIPLLARILCVADSFDTMTDDRPYRPSIGLDNALQELKYCSGSQFEPAIAQALMDVLREKGPAFARKSKGKLFYSSPSTAI